MRMLLRKTLNCVMFLLPLLALQELAIADEERDSLGWINGSYPKFCQIYGIGKPLHGGFLRFQHIVNDNIVEVSLADWTTILTIGIISDDGSMEQSTEQLHRIVPNRVHVKWKGTFRETQLELASWIGRSHLPFEMVFGNGMLFNIKPRMYAHEILEKKFMVIVDSQETIRNIQWLNTRKHQWESVKMEIKSSEED